MATAARHRRLLAISIAAACSLGAAPRSSADTTPSLALDPAPAGDRAFAVERAGVHGHLLPSARIAFDYAREPLVLRNPGQEIDAVVVNQTFMHLLGSFAVLHRFTVSVDVPFVVQQSGGPEPPGGATAPRPGTGAAFGDARLGARVKLLGSADDAEERVDLALAASVWFPTAADGYTGDDAVRVRGALILEGVTRRFYGAWSAGVRTRPSEALPGALPTRVGTALGLGFAGGFFADAQRDLAIGTEILADLTLTGGPRLFDPRATVGHFFLTGHYRIGGGPFEIGAAFGPGFAQGAGSADYRVLGLVGFAPERAAPPSDEDEDGVPDRADACINLAGVASRDPLLNGCPEPPADHDGDAIPDENDACPRVAGEPTGERRTHGCPKPVDSDGDGVPDPTDACPGEPGVRPPEGNGCPAEPPTPSTRLVEKQIVITQQVQFEADTAVLRPESDAVLGEVARVIGEHPEIELIEVQGHTDDTGTVERNRRLGQERAASVVAWLVARGVGQGRLEAKGYGADRPIADNTTEEGRAKNRRVEFHVLRTKPTAEGAAPAPGGAPPPPGGATPPPGGAPPPPGGAK